MDNVIPFPEPEKLPDIDSYPIYFNHDTGKIDMPLLPDCRDDAACVLAEFMDLLQENGILSADDILQVVLQATGDI